MKVYCMSCGSAQKEYRKTCPACGKPMSIDPPKTEKKPATATVLLASAYVLLAIALVLVSVFAYGDRILDRGYGTPEEAIETFVKALAAGDADGCLECFALESYTEGYRFGDYVDYLSYFSAAQDMPPSDGVFAGMNYSYRTGIAARRVTMLLYSLLLPDDCYSGNGYTMGDHTSAEIEGYLAKERLAGLTIIDIGTPDKESLAAYRELQLSETGFISYFGATDYTERCALVELDGATYAVAFTLYKYEDGWLITELYSNQLGVNTSRPAMPKTQEEFDVMCPD